MGAAQSPSIQEGCSWPRGVEEWGAAGGREEMDEWAGGLKKVLFVFTVPQLGLTIP